MATDATTQAVNDEVVTFDEKQQAKLDDIVRKASARAGEEARREAEAKRNEAKNLQEQLTEAQTELAKAKTARQKQAAGDDIEELQRQLNEFKTVGQQATAQLEETRKALSAKDKEILFAKEETLTLRKTQFIKDAASDANFVNAQQVYKLTSDNIRYNTEAGTFTVVTDEGTPRVNSMYEPMTVKEFYAEYAAKNPWLVKGDTKSGAGSTTSMKYDGGQTKFKVEDIFGSKSNSQLANNLAKADMTEYRRLKAQAKSQGLI